MTDWLVIPFVIGWVMVGLFNFGAAFGYMQREYPSNASEWYWSDLSLAVSGFIAGPFALPAVMLICRLGFKHGMKFW